MPGPAPAGFNFSQYPTDQQARSFDPSQASANTGINGGGGATTMTDANGSFTGAPPIPPAAGYGAQFNGGNAPPQTGGGGQVTMDAFNQAWQSSPYPGTVDGLKQFMAAHPEYAAAGITLGGSKGDKVYGPGGSYWGDAVISAGLGGKGKSSLSGDTGGGGLGSIGGANQFGQMSGFMTAPFVPPSAADALASPGSQYAIDEAMRTMQNSAAAKGTLLNGRTLQAQNNAILNQAAGQYNDVYNRAYQTNARNQDAPFQKYLQLGQLGQTAAAAS